MRRQKRSSGKPEISRFIKPCAAAGEQQKTVLPSENVESGLKAVKKMPMRCTRPSIKPSMGALSVGCCWLWVAFLGLNLPTSSLAYSIHTRGLVANVNNWLNISEDLMRASDVALHQFQKLFPCTLDHFFIQNPKNEDKIRKACLKGKSMPGSCSSGENSFVDEDSCIDTIYNILYAYAMEVKYFDTPDLSNAVNHMLKGLKPAKHGIAEQTLYSPQHILNESYEMDMKKCKIFLTLQQLAHTVHRILCYQKTVQMEISS